MTIRIVIGIDPSLSNTGIARIDHKPADHRIGLIDVTCTAVAGRKGKRNETLTQRADRMHLIAAHVSDALGTWRGNAPILLVIEGPAYALHNGSSWDRAGLWWRIVSTAMSRGALVGTVAPSTRAKWATGNGKADKAAVASALYRRFGINADSSDEADAAVLALMGAQRLNWLPHQPAYSTDSLAAAAWPANLGDRQVAGIK